MFRSLVNEREIKLLKTQVSDMESTISMQSKNIVALESGLKTAQQRLERIGTVSREVKINGEVIECEACTSKVWRHIKTEHDEQYDKPSGNTTIFGHEHVFECPNCRQTLVVYDDFNGPTLHKQLTNYEMVLGGKRYDFKDRPTKPVGRKARYFDTIDDGNVAK